MQSFWVATIQKKINRYLFTIYKISQIMVYWNSSIGNERNMLHFMDILFDPAHNFRNIIYGRFCKVLWDASILLIIAVVVVFIAALLEVYATPLVFGK